MQMVFVPGEDELKSMGGLQAFSNKDFLNTIPSYSAEQLSLNMIVWFLVVISGMLFGIFFYMMNVQKVGLYGILKAIGVKTSTLFKRSEEHTSELQSRGHLVCSLLLDKKK